MADIKYENIVFLEDSEAIESLDIYQQSGAGALLEHLKQWHCGDHEIIDGPGHGTDDEVHYFGNYELSVNTSIGYCGLVYKLIE